MTRNKKDAGGYEPRVRARRRVMQALYQWQMTGHSATEIIQQFAEQQSWERVDRDYFEHLLELAIREQDAIQSGLAVFLDRPLGQVDYLERAILQLAAAELLYQPEIPGRVVIDQAIDLAKRFAAEQGHSYVNAVLDKAARKWRPNEFLATPVADS